MENKIIFSLVTVENFVKDIVNTEEELDIKELDYYFIINDVFYPIDEVFLQVGSVKIINTDFDTQLYVNFDEMQIWKKVEE